MKAIHSEKYYRDNWNRLLERVPGKHYVNLEAELDMFLKPHINAGESSEPWFRYVVEAYAQRIAENCKELVNEEMQIIREVEAGKASFGMPQRQEVEERARFRERFEFNCLQLADFRKKYNLK